MDSKELQKRREALGLSRAALAKELFTNPATVWRWETGERQIPPYLTLALEMVERNISRRKKRAKK